MKKTELMNVLFAMCYTYNEKAYILHKKAYDSNYKDNDSEIEAIYYDGKADATEQILTEFNLINDYRKYCDKRDKGKSHYEIISKLK